MNAKKFNEKTATLAEFNRKLKAIASRKCRAKTTDEAKAAEAEYSRIKAAKDAKFGGKSINRKNYMQMSSEEIAKLTAEELRKGLNVVYSMRHYYKGSAKAPQVEAQFELFTAAIQQLEDRKKYEELRKKFA